MTARSTFIAAAVGLAVAATSLGDVSAKTIVKHVAPVATAKGSKIVAPHRFVRTPVVKHITIVRRAATSKAIKVVGATKVFVKKATPARIVVKHIFGAKTIAHVAKHSHFEKQAMIHRSTAKKTIIR